MNVTKQLRTNEDIFKLSFEYLILRIAQEWCEENSIREDRENSKTQVEEFNRLNNITMIKVLIYPFFITFSNGHLHSLFKLFGNFIYSEKFGYLSNRALAYDLEEDFLDYFSVDYERIDLKKTNESFVQQIDKIKSTKVEVDDKVYVFSKLKVNKEGGDGESEIFTAIDSGIDALMDTYRKFFNLSEYQLRLSSLKYSIKLEVGSIRTISSEIEEKRKGYFYA